jgi:hypothetical protein
VTHGKSIEINGFGKVELINQHLRPQSHEVKLVFRLGLLKPKFTELVEKVADEMKRCRYTKLRNGGAELTVIGHIEEYSDASTLPGHAEHFVKDLLSAIERAALKAITPEPETVAVAVATSRPKQPYVHHRHLPGPGRKS